MKSGQVQLIPALKACQSYVAGLSKLTRTVPTPLVGPPVLPATTTKPQLQLVHKPGSSAVTCTPKIPASYGNPCLDIYFKVTKDTTACHKTMNQLLPLAWSHNSLTTLKLIYYLLEKRGCELFYAAAFWLHENHPKTLARNVMPIVEFGGYQNVLEVLLGVLEGEDVNSKKRREGREDSFYEYVRSLLWGTKSFWPMPKRRMKRIDMVRKAVEMYNNDHDYQLLHERVSDLYAECLRADIQNLKKFEQQKNTDDANDDCNSLLELTLASKWCPSVDTFFDEATLICETIARKIFPREKCTQGVYIEDNEKKEEADYVSRIKKRLMKEVLDPLRKFMTDCPYDDDFSPEERSSVVKKYLKNVEASDFDIKADALLPHEIIRFANVRNFGKVIELQWKAMVEEMYSKRGKFNNCLAVCDVSGRMSGHPKNVSLGLGLLVSELSEEPWKGKVITFSRNPQLLSIQGDDLMSKCLFMRGMDNQDWHGDTDLQKVFDLILEAAVNGNLKPEQMVKRVFVLTSDQDFDDASGRSWKTDNEVIQRKFREKGYGDVVPRIVFWDLREDELIPVAHYAKRGVATLTGYFPHFVMLFFDNDGEIGPDHVMEAAISDKRYQSLAVVD